MKKEPTIRMQEFYLIANEGQELDIKGLIKRLNDAGKFAIRTRNNLDLEELGSDLINGKTFGVIKTTATEYELDSKLGDDCKYADNFESFTP